MVAWNVSGTVWWWEGDEKQKQKQDGSLTVFNVRPKLCGGSSNMSDLEAELNMTAVIASKNGYVGLLRDGRFVAWGSEVSISGWERHVSCESARSNVSVLDGVRWWGLVWLVSTDVSFAGVNKTGGVVSFGAATHGGEVSSSCSSYVSSGVLGIAAASSGAYAAWRRDGKVCSWGNAWAGGGVSSWQDGSLKGVGGKHVRLNVSDSLHDVKMIVASEAAFAALRGNGYVVSWGNCYYGGCAPADLPRLSWLVSGSQVFVGVKAEGRGQIVAWGKSDVGGVIPESVSTALYEEEVVYIECNRGSVSVLTSVGGLYCWGRSSYGGNCSSVSSAFKSTSGEGVGVGEVRLVSSDRAFAAWREGGEVRVWGDSGYGGEMSEEERLWASSGVQKVVSSQGAFAALKQDGSVLSWGHPGYGGDMSSVSWLLGGGVVELHGAKLSFMAVHIQDLDQHIRM
eukprot:gene9940-biopygen4997